MIRAVAGEGADLSKPSAYESEIHPSHKPTVCTQGISPCRELMPATALSS